MNINTQLRKINTYGIQTINTNTISINNLSELQQEIFKLYSIPIDFQLLVYHYIDDDNDTVSDYLTYTFPNDEYTVQIFDNLLDTDTIDENLNIQFKQLINNNDLFNRKLNLFFVDENREHFFVEKKTILPDNIIFIEIYNMLDILYLGLQLGWNEQPHKDFIKSYFPFLDVNEIFNHIIQIGRNKELDMTHPNIMKYYTKRIIDEQMLENINPIERIKQVTIYTNELILKQQHSFINIFDFYNSIQVNNDILYILYKNKNNNFKQKHFINILNNNTYTFINKILKNIIEGVLVIYKIMDTICYHVIDKSESTLYIKFYNYEYNINNIESIFDTFQNRNQDFRLNTIQNVSIYKIELYFIPNYQQDIFNIRLFKQLLIYYSNKSKLIDFDFDKDDIEWIYTDVENYNKDMHIKYIIKYLKSKNYRINKIQDIISRLFDLNNIETINYIENFDDFAEIDSNIGIYVIHNKRRIILRDFNNLMVINKFLDYFFRILILSENEELVDNKVKKIKVSGNKINISELKDNIIQAQGFTIDKRKCQKEKQPTILSRDQFENTLVGKQYTTEEDHIYRNLNKNTYAMLSKDRNFVLLCDDDIKGRKSGFNYPGFTKENIPCCTSTKNVETRINEIRNIIHDNVEHTFDLNNTIENMSKNISKDIINTDLIEMPTLINQMFQKINIIDNKRIINNGFLLLQINPLQFYLNISKNETIEDFYIQNINILEDTILYDKTKFKLPNQYKSKQELLENIRNGIIITDEYFLIYIFKLMYNINIIDYDNEQFICYDFNPNLKSAIRIKYKNKLYQVVYYNNNTLSCLFYNLTRINEYFIQNKKLFTLNEIEQKYKILTQILNKSGYVNHLIIEYNNSKITIPIIHQYASVDYPIIDVYISSDIQNILLFLEENNISNNDIRLMGKNGMYNALDTPIGMIFINEINESEIKKVINDFTLYNIMMGEDNTILTNTLLDNINKIVSSINMSDIDVILNSNLSNFEKFINIYEYVKDLTIDDKTIVYFIRTLIQDKEKIVMLTKNIRNIDMIQEISFSSLRELEKILNTSQLFYNTPEITLSNEYYTLDQIQIGGMIDISELMNKSNQYRYNNNYFVITEEFWYTFENDIVDIKIIGDDIINNTNSIHIFNKNTNKKNQYIDSQQRRNMINNQYNLNIPMWRKEMEIIINKIPKQQLLNLNINTIIFDEQGNLLTNINNINSIIKNKFSIYVLKNNKYYKLYYLNKSIFTFTTLPLVLQYKLT
jgi:hypothetical protein